MNELLSWLSHLSTGFWLLWSVYILVLSIWIVLQKREPVATLAWILALSVLPIIGFLIYHVFGPQRIRRQQHRRLRSKSRLVSPKTSAAGSDVNEMIRAMSGYPLSSATNIDWLMSGEQMFTRLLQEIRSAHRQIHLLYYIFEPDTRGTQIRDALIESAKNGVAVRVLLDAIGSVHLTDRFLQPLRDAGVEIAFFHRMRFRLRGLWAPKLNLRNHRKIVVIDERISLTGGMNITDQQDRSLKPDAFHDLHVCVQGDVVHWLQYAFLQDWVYVGKHLPKDVFLQTDTSSGDIRAQVIPAGPDSNTENIHRTQVHLIHHAKRRVWLCTPYFVPSAEALMALSNAALRGIDVRVLVPQRADSLTVTYAARSYFDELCAAGVRVFQYPHMLHAKVLLVDDDVLVGSANFDVRSFRLNFELGLLLQHAQCAEQIRERLAQDFSTAEEVSRGRALSFLSKLGEAVARLFSPLL
jgi:cardiolipin synthase A/B